MSRRISFACCHDHTPLVSIHSRHLSHPFWDLVSCPCLARSNRGLDGYLVARAGADYTRYALKIYELPLHLRTA